MDFISIEKRKIGNTENLLKSLDILFCKTKLCDIENNIIPNVMFENIEKQLGVLNKFCVYTSIGKTSKGYYICFSENNTPKFIFVNNFGLLKIKLVVKNLKSDGIVMRHISSMFFNLKDDFLVLSTVEKSSLLFRDDFERDIFKVVISNSLQVEIKDLSLYFQQIHRR